MRGRPDYLDHEDEDHFDRLVAEAVVKRKVSASDRNGSSHGGLSLDGHQAHIWRVSDASVAPAPLPQFIPMPFKHRDLATFPRRQFVYGRHLARGYVSAPIAASGIGKSSLSIAECVAMTPGENLLGIQPAKALKVWYWNGEDPAEEILRRIEATCLHFGVDPELVEGRLFVDSGRDSEIIVANQARSGFVIATPVVDALTEALKNGAFDVLIIDPFVSAHRVGENDNMAIDAVAKSFGRIASTANCAIEIVHHVRKTGGAEVTAEDGCGASSHVAASRSVRELNRMSEKEAEQAGIDKERRFYFRSDIDKANLAPPSRKATWFRLANVALGNGSGCPIDDQDYVGVAILWQWPDAFAGVTLSDLRAVQARVAAGRWRESSQVKDWAGYAVADVLKLDATNRANKVRISSLLKTWTKNGMFVVVEGGDGKRMPRKFIEVGTPADD